MDDLIINSGYELERQWKEYLGLTSFEDLNNMYRDGWTKELIMVCEAMHDRRMVEITDHIKNSGARLILLSGPSSSGKTTTALKLCTHLCAVGLRPAYLGIDDYYKNRDDIPVGPDGLRDFESLSAIDMELFNDQVQSILDGETVDVPSFDFISGKKVFGKKKMRAEPGHPIVIEGILALNPEFYEQLPEEKLFRIYTCPLSCLRMKDGNRIPKAEIRKIRRLVRDHAKRGWGLEQTFEMWPKVRDGEVGNIFPYSKMADEVFNSSQPYELSVLKKRALPLLETEPGSKFEAEAKRLRSLFDQIDSIEDESLIEADSVIREFIGGGSL